MEPDVVRMYSSSPPPLEDGAEEEDDEFGDFGTFCSVPGSVSLSEFETQTTFNQTQALTATSPPELLSSRGGVGFPGDEPSRSNGVGPRGHPDLDRTESRKTVSYLLDSSVRGPAECNGGDPEVLTNGFLTFDLQGSPSPQNSVHSPFKGLSTEDTVPSPEDQFADFSAFSSAEGRLSLETTVHNQRAEDTVRDTEDTVRDEVRDTEDMVRDTVRDKVRDTEDTVRDTEDTVRDTEDAVRDTVRDTEDKVRDTEDTVRDKEDTVRDTEDTVRDTEDTVRDTEDTVRDKVRDTEDTVRDMVRDTEDTVRDMEDMVRDTDRTAAELPGGLSTRDTLQRDIVFTEDPPQTDCTDAAQSDEKSTETETETSFGRPLSTEALEEYGDTSLTGSVPSPPLQGDTATPAEDDEDFGDFGDSGSFGGQDFAGFEDLEVQQDQNTLQGSGPAQNVAHVEQEDDFGDFSSPGLDSGGDEGGQVPASDSFGTFSSAAGGQQDSGWSAFGDQQETEEESWAEFSTEPSAAPPAEREEQEEEEEWHEAGHPAVREQVDRTAEQTVLLSSRLEKLFHCSFRQNSVQNQQLEDQVVSLKVLLDPTEDRVKPGAEEEEEEQRSSCSLAVRSTMWSRLQDVNEAVGLRYQWGGSHCNKVLLCCLGIDTRNILFTGQKNKPVIVPMYAAGLGMLEPTKEPVKPVSAAEMIASIAQTPPAAPETSSCPSDSVQQEALPPVQFDWSSSGLTNPLDASGGSALLNLDFFGPVEDSGSSSSASIPGVDPELFELTTAKLDSGGSGSRVADAFARLMSTMEKTSTSTRKPRKDENLSEEAVKVMAALPDLSFMQAKVLMFPATLTPLSSQAVAD